MRPQRSHLCEGGWAAAAQVVALLGVLLPTVNVVGLQFEDLPPKVVNMEYAVRGELDLLAQDLKERLSQENHGLPFDEIVACNIGNPQALGQQPLSYHRQVLTLLANPSLQETMLYPHDVHERARHFTNATASIGAYTHAKGAAPLRRLVADFIERRDGPGSAYVDPETIFLTDGASPAVRMFLSLLVSGPADAVLIPVPQYPLYSAALTNLGGTAVEYYLDEAAGWSVSMQAVREAVANFQREQPHGRLKAMVLINPGNPTGNVMTHPEMEAVVRFCHEQGIVLFADEVYQENIWSPLKTWESFRKVVLEMRLPVEVVSFHSISKGYYGECGLRGGYMQLHNVDKRVQEQLYKLASINLCSNTVGQAMTASVMNPPAEGEASYPVFQAERAAILHSLQRKAVMVNERLNGLPGVSCQQIEGALYAFPRIDLPLGAVEAASAAGKAADVFYCVELLKATGIVVVPGSGFRQRPGTWHFRITILPSEDKLPSVLDRLERFHRAFWAKYSVGGGTRAAGEL